jgi:Tripartite tricarboxylate transporter TctB family
VRARIDIPDLAFALFLIAVGGLAFVLVGELRSGTGSSMGPGYVPRGLAGLVILFGVGLGIRALASARDPFPEIDWRALALISGALLSFMLVYPRAGLVAGSLAAMICAGFASSEVRPIENAIFAVALTIFAVLLFVQALGLPLQVWPG